MPISGKYNPDKEQIIEKQNMKFMNRVFRIICRDNQYQVPRTDIKYYTNSSDEDSDFCMQSQRTESMVAPSTTTMFNRSPDIFINP